MLKRETSKTYELKIGDTVYTIESEAPEDCRIDMIDALIALMKRNIEALSEK